MTYNPLHYLALLERKPGGLDFAKPLERWDLPKCFGVLRRRLEAERAGEGTREFIKVLRLLEHASPGELGKAIDYALDIGTTEADAVRLILEHRREQPVKLFHLEGRPHLADVVVRRNSSRRVRPGCVPCAPGPVTRPWCSCTATVSIS